MRKRNEILVGLLICLSIFLQICLVSAWSDNGNPTQNVNGCGSLTTNSAVYTLTQNIDVPYNSSLSLNGCFNILNENITLNCNGYEINFVNAGQNKYGVKASSNLFLIKNCNIIMDSTYGQVYPIYIVGSLGVIFHNNLTTNNSQNGYGIQLNYADSNFIYQNKIITYGYLGFGMDFIYGNDYNTIEDNDITTTQALSIYLLESSHNIFLNNRFTSFGNRGIQMYGSTNNSFTDMNIISSDYSVYVASTWQDFIMTDSILESTSSNIELYFDNSVSLGECNLVDVTRPDLNSIRIHHLDCNNDEICDSELFCGIDSGETYTNCPNDCSPPPTPPMSWEEVDLDENIVNPQNTEQGLLPSIYYGMATFLSNIMTPAIIIIFVIFFCLIIGVIGIIIKKIAMKI
jgi:parallel beta-helix repeat protein